MNSGHFNQRRAGLGTAEEGEHIHLHPCSAPQYLRAWPSWPSLSVGQPLLQICPLGVLWEDGDCPAPTLLRQLLPGLRKSFLKYNLNPLHLRLIQEPGRSFHQQTHMHMLPSQSFKGTEGVVCLPSLFPPNILLSF